MSTTVITCVDSTQEIASARKPQPNPKINRQLNPTTQMLKATFDHMAGAMTPIDMRYFS
jgi:hypothetical protein